MMNKKFLLLGASALAMFSNSPAKALDTEDLNSKNISWEAVDSSGPDVILISDILSPENSYQFFKYTRHELAPDELTYLDRMATTYPHGGALSLGRKDEMTALFRGNYASYGGALYDFSVDNLTADFIKNHAKDDDVSYRGKPVTRGGAIYNAGTITNIKDATFTGNKAHWGATIANTGTITNIKDATFTGNKAHWGATIANTGTIKNIENTKFSENLSSQRGGAIYNTGLIENILSTDFIGNESSSSNAAIYNTGTIQKISANFEDNFSYSTYGALENRGTIDEISDSVFKNNRIEFDGLAGLGGAMYNDGNTKLITNTVFENNSAYAGGAIFQEGHSTLLTITNSTFKNNHAAGVGGAILAQNNFSINADDGTTEFTGNYVQKDEDSEKVYNAIYLHNPGVKLTLNAINNGEIIFNDTIDGSTRWGDEERNYKVEITGDKDSRVVFNNSISNADITLSDTTVDLTNVAYLTGNNTLTVNSGLFNLSYLGLGDTLTANAITLNGGVLNIAKAEADLANRAMGHIDTSVMTVNNDAKINVESFVLTSDSDTEKTRVEFAKDLKDSVTTSLTEDDKISVSTTAKAVAPIYQYTVGYDAESGEFVFTRFDATSSGEDPNDPKDDDPVGPNDPTKPSIPSTPVNKDPSYLAYNPGVFASSVAAQSAMNTQGAIATAVMDFGSGMYSFGSLPLDNDGALSAQTQTLRGSSAHRRNARNKGKDRGFGFDKGHVWATPFFSNDTVRYSDFYDVDSRSYGVIAGIDSKVHGDVDSLKRIYTIFAGFSDGKDEYQGITAKTRSWVAGLKASVYQGNFYGDALVNYGAHDTRIWTLTGKERLDNVGYGAAARIGYRFAFDDMILDTSAMLNWQTIQGESYETAQGVKVTTDDFSRLSFVPQLKLSYDLCEQARPYALVRYNMSLSESGGATLNRVIELPEMEGKDFVEYGLGIETTNTGKHNGFAQVLHHEGGREGWSGTLGYRYKL